MGFNGILMGFNGDIRGYRRLYEQQSIVFGRTMENPQE
jgi:hypothetical protein